MEKEYVMQVAQIIKEQLVTLTPMTVLMSWRYRRICRHPVQGVAGTPHQGKWTTARRDMSSSCSMARIITRFIL